MLKAQTEKAPNEVKTPEPTLKFEAVFQSHIRESLSYPKASIPTSTYPYSLTNAAIHPIYLLLDSASSRIVYSYSRW
jgi:hypothetical protein